MNEDDLPLKVRIRLRPTSPSLVGKTGTAVRHTEDYQLRIEMDTQPGTQWAQTILVLPEDIEAP